MKIAGIPVDDEFAELCEHLRAAEESALGPYGSGDDGRLFDRIDEADASA